MSKIDLLLEMQRQNNRAWIEEDYRERRRIWQSRPDAILAHIIIKVGLWIERLGQRIMPEPPRVPAHMKQPVDDLVNGYIEGDW